MANVDYGLFQALTGPMQASNAIQQDRDAQRLKKLQLEEQEYQLQAKEIDRQNALQKQIDLFAAAANKAVFSNGTFKRQKDVDDYTAWHEEHSGWKDIQQILKQYGTVANAYKDGRLAQALAVYKQRMQTASDDPTKGNPVYKRAMDNLKNISQYKKYALDDGYAKFLTAKSHENYKAWEKGEIENFIYTGVRGDYLDEASKPRNKSDDIDIDEVIATNISAIATDMEKDLGLHRSSFSQQDIRDWLSRELQYEPGDVAAGIPARFGGEVIYGAKDIETSFSKEIITSLDATEKLGIKTGEDYFNLIDQGVSFNELFDDNQAQNWDRLGGYNRGAKVHSTKGFLHPSKGMELVASSRLFTNPNTETAITNSWAGTEDDGKTFRYNTKNRKVRNIQTNTLWDNRGHKITDKDIASTWITGKDLWQESETMNLRLSGYHIVLQATNKHGESFLLTDVSSEDDKRKMREQYKDVVFTPVMVAELIDDDLGPDDPYYRKVEMDVATQSAINKSIDSEDLNKVLNENATYEQRIAQEAYGKIDQAKREKRLVKMMDLPDEASLKEVAIAYDKSLSVGLSTAGVPSAKIQQAIPLIMADLFVNSRQEREYPFVVEKDLQGNPTKVAYNPSEYMAYKTQHLKTALINGSPGFEAMLEAIKTGDYDAYRETSMDKKSRTTGKKVARELSKYYNNQ